MIKDRIKCERQERQKKRGERERKREKSKKRTDLRGEKRNRQD